MRKDLDEALCAKYPLIFKDRNADMRTTAMCWGFECGDGWYNILDTLCGLMTSEYRGAQSRYDFIKDRVGEKMYGNASGDVITQEKIDYLKEDMDNEATKVPVASQVKEKFGGLRFYCSNGATDKHWSFISFAESMSYVTCEVCGSPGKRYTDGWHKTLCDIHAAMDGREINEGEEFELDEDAQ
jgi:hypothetical protein